MILFLYVPFILSDNTSTPENDTSGKEALVSLVGNDETGVLAYNKKYLHPVQSQNLFVDVNLAQVAKFFDCKTEMGHAFLIDALSKPLSPQDAETILKNRQHIIQLLVENPDFKEYTEHVLERAKVHEKEVIILLSDFFIGKYCSEFKMIEEGKAKKLWGVSFSDFLASSPTIRTIESALWGTATAAWLVGTAIGCNEWIKREIKRPSLEAIFCVAASNCMLVSMCLLDYHMASVKRNKIHALNQLVEIAEDIKFMYEKLDLTSQFDVSNITQKEGQYVINSLKHSRYQNANTRLFFSPAVHPLLYTIYKEKKQLVPILASIAELDAYNAIATKVIQSKNSSNPFCFVTHLESPYPYINMKDFWNVLIKNAVPNTLTEDRSLILTGPNAGGKTTAIRSILQNIVLAQTFGIAAARECSMTMFDVIHSYLNISDDYVSGLSLFAAEVKRAQQIIQHLKTLEPGQKFFFGLDELFTGTNAEDGETCAYEFVKRLAEFNNAQFVYATHFNKMKELASESEFCTNYKVDAPTKNEDGTLVYPFTLSPGASDSRVALDIAQKAGLFA